MCGDAAAPTADRRNEQELLHTAQHVKGVVRLQYMSETRGRTPCEDCLRSAFVELAVGTADRSAIARWAREQPAPTAFGHGDSSTWHGLRCLRLADMTDADRQYVLGPHHFDVLRSQFLPRPDAPASTRCRGACGPTEAVGWGFDAAGSVRRR